MSISAEPGSARARLQQETDRNFVLAGGVLAVTGLSHFVVPSLFRGPTALLFPDDPARAVRINGASETLIGIAIALPATRALGLSALGIYGGYLGRNGLQAMRRGIRRAKSNRGEQ